ncbi:MAG TPA: CBS domain-containing protein, partial [Kofleriaceae bacterium]|nr:CBS domain-containing protein [Kofleriaceae bacterium]
MSGDDSVPEEIPDRAAEATGEISMLPPEEAQKIAEEIRAVAESRGSAEDDLEDSVASEHSTASARDSSSSIRTRKTSIPPPMPSEGPARAEVADDGLSADELRDAWPLLDLEERADGLRVLDREDAEDFFVALPPADQCALILHFRAGQRRQWMRLLEPDDVADLVQEAGEDHKPMLLALLDGPTRKEVTALMAYEEDEAGGLMSTRYARLRPQMSVGEAITYLQRQARDRVETIYTAYVLDADQRLLGVVSFRDLLLNQPTATVAEIMETEVQRVTDEMPQEAVSHMFAEHDLTVMPVVDRDGRMKGIVTVDDIVDVVREAATEDAHKFGGMESLDIPYLE